MHEMANGQLTINLNSYASVIRCSLDSNWCGWLCWYPWTRLHCGGSTTKRTPNDVIRRGFGKGKGYNRPTCPQGVSSNVSNLYDCDILSDTVWKTDGKDELRRQKKTPQKSWFGVLFVSRDGAVVRALSSHQGGSGWIPRLDVTRGLSLVLLYLLLVLLWVALIWFLYSGVHNERYSWLLK